MWHSGGAENRTFDINRHLSLSLAWANGACKLLLRVRGSLFLIRLRFLMGSMPTTLLSPLLCSRGKCRMFFPVTEDFPSPCACLSPLWACRILAEGRQESWEGMYEVECHSFFSCRPPKPSEKCLTRRQTIALALQAHGCLLFVNFFEKWKMLKTKR